MGTWRFYYFIIVSDSGFEILHNKKLKRNKSSCKGHLLLMSTDCLTCKVSSGQLPGVLGYKSVDAATHSWRNKAAYLHLNISQAISQTQKYCPCKPSMWVQVYNTHTRRILPTNSIPPPWLIPLFCAKSSSRQVRPLSTSAMTTAVVAKKRSPGSVRV